MSQKKSNGHHHRWNFPHVVFEGRNDDPDEIGVVRYCDVCGVKQMAFTSAWQRPPRSYDLRDVEMIT